MTFALLVLLALPQDDSSLRKMEKEIQLVLDKVRPSVALVTSVFKLESGQVVEELSFSGVVYSKDGHRVLAMVTPIYNEASCSSAACHAHPPSQRVLGVVDVGISLAEADAELAELQRSTLSA